MAELKLNLSPSEIGRIVGFLGYGRPSARVWFVGIEEGLAKMNSNEAIENLKARATFEEVMDLRDAHIRLKEKGKYIDMEVNPPHTQVWQYMAKIMRACSGHKDWANLKAADEYVRYKLGRADGETFLTELSPFPSKKVGGKIGTKKWKELFKELDPELEDKLERRKNRLKEVLTENASSLIICYGTKWAKDFADALGVQWQAISPKVSIGAGGRYLLLPFLGVGHISHQLIEELLQQGCLNCTQYSPLAPEHYDRCRGR